MNQSKLPKRITVFKECIGEWAPNFKLEGKYKGRYANLVAVSFLKLLPYKGEDSKECLLKYRVCVWGADDFGMERDFIHRDQALKMFNKVIAQEKISPLFLKDNDFVRV